MTQVVNEWDAMWIMLNECLRGAEDLWNGGRQ